MLQIFMQKFEGIFFKKYITKFFCFTNIFYNIEKKLNDEEKLNGITLFQNKFNNKSFFIFITDDNRPGFTTNQE